MVMPPSVAQTSADPVNRWLHKHPEVIGGRPATQSRIISLDPKQLQDLGSSSCKWYQKILTFIREKGNPAQWFQSEGEKLVKEHNTEVIRAVLRKDPHSCLETRITDVTSFLQAHYSIPSENFR